MIMETYGFGLKVMLKGSFVVSVPFLLQISCGTRPKLH